MSYYPKRYPTLDKSEWRLEPPFDTTEGLYTSPVIDAGCAIAWSGLHWEADMPAGSAISIRTRFGMSQEECLNARWSRKHATSPLQVDLEGSTEMYHWVAAAQFLQVRAEIVGEGSLKSARITGGLLPPACVGPMNQGIVEDGRPVFYWTRVEGAATYSLELSSDPGFARLLDASNDLSETRFDFGERLDPGVYYWRVAAVDGAGRRTDFSAVRQFRVGSRPKADPARLRHPYLYFTSDEFPAIKQRLIERHPAIYESVLKNAEDALLAELPDEKDVLSKAGQHSDFHQLSRSAGRGKLESLSLAWLLTGDDKYAARARDVLLYLSGYSRWTGVPFGDPERFYPTWQGTLETATMCKGVATAYDWIYDYLSEDDRATVREGLLRLGVLPLIESWSDPKTIRYIPRHQVAHLNWFAVCNSGGGVGALALLAEVPDAARWVGMVADAIRAYLVYPGGDYWNTDLKAGWGKQYLIATEPNWGEDGGYVESVGYAIYGLGQAMYFVEALKRVTGEELGPCINPRLIDHPVYTLYREPGGAAKTVNFNDSGDHNFTDELCAMLVKHTRSGRARWLLETGHPVRQSVHAILADVEGVEPEAPGHETRNKLFRDIGWCVFRSGWDEDSSLFAAKFRQGRGHRDIGQFVIRYKGRPFVVDSGSGDYGSSVYRDYLYTTYAHNVVLVDDQPQMKVDGRVVGYKDAGMIGVVEADLTAAYQDLIESWTRTLIYLEPDTFVVVDRLVSDVDRTYSWQIHPKAETELLSGAGAVMRRDGVQMQLRLLSPSALVAQTKQGYIGSDPADYLAFATDQACKDVTFFAAFVGSEQGGAVELETHEDGCALGVRVTTPEARHTVLIRMRGEEPLTGWGITAEGQICARTEFDNQEPVLLQY